MPQHIINHVTGEVVDTSDLAALVGERANIDDTLGNLRDARAAIDAEITAMLNRDLRRSAKVGKWEVKVNAPTKEEVDWDLLRARLVEIAASNDAPISLAAVDAVVRSELVEPEPYTEQVTNKTELNKLRKLMDPAVQGAIEEAVEVVDQPQRLTVKAADPKSVAA